MYTLANVSPWTTLFVVNNNVTDCNTLTSSIDASIRAHSVSVMYLAPFASTTCWVISLCNICKQH